MSLHGRAWLNEFDRDSPGYRAVVIAPLQNKVGAMLTDPRQREILTAKGSSFDVLVQSECALAQPFPGGRRPP